MQLGTKRYWLFQFVGWGLFALINVFFALTFDKINTLFLNRLFIFLFIGILFTHLMRWVILKIDLLFKPLNKQIPGFIAITLIVSLILAFIEVIIYNALNLQGQRNDYSFFGQLLVNTFNTVIYLFIWNCIYFIYHYVQKSRKQQLDTLQLEALVKTLELKTIKAHINPHFIFNAMNSIRALIDENPVRARNAITELSNILRSSMQTEKLETVPFERELNIVKDYLALENMRFEDRLKVEYEIDEDTLSQQVPPMMLQTLVENALKHGISKNIKGGVVKIISDFKDDFHEMVVQNTGYLNGSIHTEGFGLSSTQNRLNLLYGSKAHFNICQLNASLVEAKVLIPVETI
ncbi:MAG TPA: histidine kinase [Chitinophagaceae bacterium]|jgi:Putative regulator of cell autolysis